MDLRMTALAILEIAVGLEGLQDKGMREIQLTNVAKNWNSISQFWRNKRFSNVEIRGH